MDDFLRYNCQVMLPGFGHKSQVMLQLAKVLVVGAGGLGCPAAQYLAAAGIGTLGIADFDTVATRNLHRQLLFSPNEVGLKKALVACGKLRQQNPQITIVAHDVQIAGQNAADILGLYDVVLDCTDNFDTRYLLNDTCVLLKKPLVYGAIYQFEGQVAVWNVANSDGTRSPNYRDVYPAVNASQIPSCAEGGVIPTIAGIIGCMQANEAIKCITHSGELLAGRMLVFDAQTMQSRIITIGTATKTNIFAIAQPNETPFITASVLKQAISTDKYLLVDVRSLDEHEAFNIGGLHIPLNEVEMQSTLLNAGKPVVFYCASGKRSGVAVQIAKKLLFDVSFFSLQNGLDAWPQD